MSVVVERGTSRVALRVALERNRSLLGTFLAEYDVVEITDTVPTDTDLCIVDERGFARVGDSLVRWKRDQRPSFAPVLLLARQGRLDPWERHADALGSRIDAIHPIPGSKAAIRSRVESLLGARRYSMKLEAERRLVERIFDTSPIAKVLVDPDGSIVRANSRAEEIFDAPAGEPIPAADTSRWNIVDENGDPIPSEDLPFDRAVATGEPQYARELCVERPDGERMWLSVNVAPLQDDAGAIEYLVCALENITQRKELERTLESARDRYESLFNSIRDALLVADTDRRIVNCNLAFTDLFGYSLDEIAGKPTKHVYESEAEFEAMGELIRGHVGDPRFVQTVSYEKKSGQVFPGETSVFYLRDGGGQVTGFIGYIRDVSEREARLQQLQVIDRALQHNVHNDVNIIQGYSETILEDVDGAVAEHAAVIRDTGAKLLNTIENEREITKFLANPPPLKTIDVDWVVEQVVGEVRTRYPDARIRVTTPSPVPVTGTVYLDYAIEELLENAIVHAGHDAPTVEVTVTTDEDAVRVRVADDGPGIPDMEKDVLLGDAEMQPVYHGSGFGLWLVRLIVRHADGTLAFDENDPVGSVVTISLLAAE